MSKAVRFDDYGGIEVLEVRDVARPQPGPDQVLVAVRAAGINPSDGKIRAGLVREIFPATFPSGEGSDLGERRSNVVERVAALDRDDEVWPSVGSVVWLCGHAPAGRQVRLWCGLRREPMLAITDSKHGVLLP
jgi:NADPH:quinone reductase-like Zn-dependent oxidoreductase